MEQTHYSIPENTQSQEAHDQKEIIALLARQNELLDHLQKNLLKTMRLENDQHNTVSSRVIDINMSIGSMIAFMLKWLVASIPVGIIIALVWLVVTVVFAGAFGALGALLR